MSERLERWHVETEETVTDEELIQTIFALEEERQAETTSPRRAAELERRINHLIFEAKMRTEEAA